MEAAKKERDKLAAALMLFYLFERFCAGFLKWASRETQFDNKLAEFLEKKKEKDEKQEWIAQACGQGAEFDTLLMPRDLQAYLAIRADEKEQAPIFGNTSPFRAKELFKTVSELIAQRNKLMHGGYAPGDLHKAANSLAGPMNAIGAHASRLLRAFSQRDRTDNSWARLTFLTSAELMWIAEGRLLPMVDASVSPMANIVIRQNNAPFAVLRRTDPTAQPYGVDAIGTDPQNGRFFDALWIGDKPIPRETFQEATFSIGNQAAYHLNMPQNALTVFELTIGPDDGAGDPLRLPWWRHCANGGQCVPAIGMHLY